VTGWVRSVRVHKRATFVSLSDGSVPDALQVVVASPDTAVRDLVAAGLSTGAAVRARGAMRAHPRGGAPELHVDARDVDVLGPCDAARYPLQKKEHSSEFLRSIAHLRPRSAAFGSTLRVRARAARVLRSVLEDRHAFAWVSTPILSGNDCEGAGELFHVTVPGADRFFNADRVHLTVSGQLHAEAFAAGLSRVYTFGPTFRAENSNTTRHLAEFWMLEPEMSFASRDDAVALAFECVEACARDALESCADELATLAAFDAQRGGGRLRGAEGEEGGLEQRLARAADRSKFVRLSYAEAARVLERSAGDAAAAYKPLRPRQALSSEHERFLVERYCGGRPLVVVDFPREVKPFYALANDDADDTVACFDVLVPGIGELVGGSAREHRAERLERRMREDGVLEGLEWYLDLRRFGTAPHAGFGLGFDRLVQFLTGQDNIRDVVPLHRARGEMEF